MDKTELYINMTNCPEIQKGHKFIYGDIYVFSGNVLVVAQRQFPVVNCPWLPRQDQLQEMVGCNDIQVALHRLYQVAEFWIGRDLQSLEQLWLAFVMKELHNKTWNGTEWETTV